MSKRVLLLYATREGQTARIAARIDAGLRQRGAEVLLVDARDADATARLAPADFDLLVFGASMHAGGIERELVAFIERNRDAIGRCMRSFFLVLLSAATRDPALREKSLADAIGRLERQLALKFDEIETIAGALMYSKYRWPIRQIMQRIARQAGGDTDTSRDYDYTDWGQVEAYAARLAARLG